MTKKAMFIRMISASLMRRRSRMLIALLSVAIGATVLSGLVTIYNDVPRQMGAQFRSYGANMILTASGEGFSQADAEHAVAQIGKDDLVGWTPYRYENIRVHDHPVVAAGTSPEGTQKTSPYWSVDGDWFQSDGEIMVGANVAESFRLKAGEMLTVSYTAELSAEDGRPTQDSTMDLKITGILETGGSEEDYVYMTLSDLTALTGTEGKLDVCEVSVSGGQTVLDSVLSRINTADSPVQARLVKRVTASETTVLAKLQALVLLVTVVVLALTMICVATTMTAVVAERRKEIGLRKAIGAPDSAIIRECLGESMLLGLLGGLLGALLGFLFAQYVSSHVFSGTISFRPLLLPVTVLVSVAVTGLASLMPIRSATEVDPALVLKGE